MPRRRMLDPSFWDDTEVAKLTRDERLFLLGCLNNADDEGRLKAHPAYLKAAIFMYDNDLSLDRLRELKEGTLKKMKSWPERNPWRLISYQNAEEDYFYFPNWFAHQKPSHPSPSKLPVPPDSPTPETIQQPSGKAPEEIQSASALGQSRSVKSSLVKGSIGKVSVVQEDFKKYFSSESDLTDFLTTKLAESISAARQVGAKGEQWAIVVLEQFWNQAVGKISTEIFMGALDALKKYPVPVVARAFVKASRYHGGKHGKWKYIQTIIDEEMEKGHGS